MARWWHYLWWNQARRCLRQGTPKSGKSSETKADTASKAIFLLLPESNNRKQGKNKRICQVQGRRKSKRLENLEEPNSESSHLYQLKVNFTYWKHSTKKYDDGF